jgi:hypothetical protein
LTDSRTISPANSQHDLSTQLRNRPLRRTAASAAAVPGLIISTGNVMRSAAVMLCIA